ncbi:polymeric immunoglobulin receptor-like isoform X2 [Brachyhypopomus gauderio]|uniref:polymeric immunoglobulin receptor-like isoform X2 n=1 Tax=Brachyhypopomus gauderio TaxID=698409 RepID=UPI00404236D4
MRCILTVEFIIMCILSRSSYERKISLQRGASVTVPCHYESKYIHHKKYWCFHEWASFPSCTVLAYVNTTQENMTVMDDPAHGLFTASMRDLRQRNTGRYWCAVEIIGADVKEEFHISVTSESELSVLGSRVSGEEGSSVSVQCLYSAAYQNKQKQWCRSTDWSCYTVERTHTSQNSAVQISDDGKTSFTVEMSGLKKSDAGWYWCSVGDVQVPVHLNVTDALAKHLVSFVSTVGATMTTIAGSEMINMEQTPPVEQRPFPRHGSIMLVWLPVAVGICLLVILVSIIFWTLIKKSKETQERSHGPADHTSSALDQDDVTYSIVKVLTKRKTTSTTEEPVTYCTLAETNVGLYASIYTYINNILIVIFFTRNYSKY